MSKINIGQKALQGKECDLIGIDPAEYTAPTKYDLAKGAVTKAVMAAGSSTITEAELRAGVQTTGLSIGRMVVELILVMQRHGVHLDSRIGT